MKNKKKNQKKRRATSFWERPWMKQVMLILIVALSTGLAFLIQQYAPWLGASIMGVPTCVQDSGRIVKWPIDGLLSDISKSSVEKAILDRKISTLHGKSYSTKEDALKVTFNALIEANDATTLAAVEEQQYQDGGHIGIDMPIWWKDDKDHVSIYNPFNQAQVYKTWKLDDGSKTWGNAVTLCFTNSTGTYFAHFAHMKDVPMVTEGQTVKAGDQLGLVGNTGDSYGAHLHFQINRAARYNPYYTSKKSEMISTFVDPLLLALKPTLVMDNVLVAGPAPTDFAAASIFDLSLSASSSTAKVGESVKVSIEAKDKNGSPVSGKVKVASTVPVNIPSEKELTQGKGEFTVTSDKNQSVELIVASSDGSVSRKVAIEFKSDAPVVTDTTTNATTTNSAGTSVFTDVTSGSVSGAELEAIKYLKDQGITTGNPDGSFGINQNLNRAAAATFLIRAFYPQIELASVKVDSLPFSDVDPSAWYAAPIYVANKANYNGIEKPVFIKGSAGKAMPASNVKLEEFAAMILRVLKVDVPTTEPWYDGYMTKMQQIGILSQSESASGLGKSMSRKQVARILYQAILWQKSHPDGLQDSGSHMVATAGTADVIPPNIDPPRDLKGTTNTDGQPLLEWLPSVTPNIGYNVLRSETGESYDMVMTNLTTPNFVDTFAPRGKKYFYRVEAQNLNTGEKSTQTNMVEVSN